MNIISKTNKININKDPLNWINLLLSLLSSLREVILLLICSILLISNDLTSNLLESIFILPLTQKK